MSVSRNSIKFLVTIIIVTSILFLFECGDKSTGPDSHFDPVISNLIAPDSLIKGIADTTLIYLTVSDPQGLDDIDSVYFTVTRPDGTSNNAVYYLFDDGVNGGDSSAMDGVYTQGIQSPTGGSQTGDYVFQFNARDLDGHLSNTINKTITAYVYDNPVIRRIIVNQYDDQRRFLFVSAKVLDAQGQVNIERVWANITYVDQDTMIGSFDLNDFGNDGDSTALDGYYSLAISAPVDTVYQAGSYLIEFHAQDYDNNLALPADTTIIINPPI